MKLLLITYLCYIKGIRIHFFICVEYISMNIVPIYQKNLLGRSDRYEVNSVTEYITNTDLQDLVDASRTTPVRDVVEQWMLTSVAGGGNLDTGGVDYGCKRARNALHAARIRRSGSEH